MTPAELRDAIERRGVADCLHPLAAMKTEDGRVHAGRDAVLEALFATPSRFDGFTAFEDGSRASVAGRNAAGIALKLSLYEGLVGRIVAKRPEPGRQRMRLVVAYDGTEFFGFQRQLELRSVQAELEGLVSRVNGVATTVNGASRTDTGVHARGQVVHFDTVRDFDSAKWMTILNHAAPDDLCVVSAERTHPLFHSRFDVWEKEYRYTLDLGAYDPLKRHFRWYCGPLDADVLSREIVKIVGTHDFTSFCKGEKDSKVRTIKEARVEQNGSELVLVFVGDGFLHNMIRLLAASLVGIAKGELDVDMRALLDAKNRDRTRDLAPPGGLTLIRVDY